MALITSILSIFGSGLGTLFGMILSWWQKKAQDEKVASDQMNQDIQAHSGDGALSVGDVDSANWQLNNINQKLDQMDSQAPIEPTKGN